MNWEQECCMSECDWCGEPMRHGRRVWHPQRKEPLFVHSYCEEKLRAKIAAIPSERNALQSSAVGS